MIHERIKGARLPMFLNTNDVKSFVSLTKDISSFECYAGKFELLAPNDMLGQILSDVR